MAVVLPDWTRQAPEAFRGKLATNADMEMPGLSPGDLATSGRRDIFERVLRAEMRASKEQIPAADRVRDLLFRLLMGHKGFRNGVDHDDGAIGTVFELGMSSALLGFTATARRLSKNSSVFDTGLGEMIAEMVMTRFLGGRSLRASHLRTRPIRGEDSSRNIRRVFAFEVEGETDSDRQEENVRAIKEQLFRFQTLDLEDEPAELAIKLTAFTTDFHLSDSGYERAYECLRQIAELACRLRVRIIIDPEEYK